MTRLGHLYIARRCEIIALYRQKRFESHEERQREISEFRETAATLADQMARQAITAGH